MKAMVSEWFGLTLTFETEQPEMDRRELLATLIGGIVAAKYSSVPSLLTGGISVQKKLDLGTKRLKFGDLSLGNLRNDYHYYLFDDFLPFMDEYVIDHKYGGFMCNADRDGTRLDTKKRTWFEGRGIWVYSFLYRHFGRNEKYLDVATNSLKLIMKTRPSGDDLWPSVLSREGEPLTPPSKRIYGSIFVAEGLNEYSLATGESKYWDMAKEIVLKCWRIYNRPDYYPNIVADYSGPKEIPFPGSRIQGVAMVMINTINGMLNHRSDVQLEAIRSECIDAVINKHFNPKFNLNNELLNHEYSRPDNYLSEFVYPGHSIETLRFIMEFAVKHQDLGLFRTATERFKRHVEVAWDQVYSGILRSLNNVDQDEWEIERTPKVLWAQQEALNGMMVLIEQSGDEWAKSWFAKVYTYMVAKYWLKRYGYHLWITAADREVTFTPHYDRIENYHLPRHLMLTYLALDRLIKNDARPAWRASAVNEE